jgi:hypothetical protein
MRHDRWRRRARRRILDQRGDGLTLVERKRATRATTFDHVEIEIGFPLFPHDSGKNKAPRSRLFLR